jgi:hypothetical protein
MFGGSVVVARMVKPILCLQRLWVLWQRVARLPPQSPIYFRQKYLSSTEWFSCLTLQYFLYHSKHVNSLWIIQNSDCTQTLFFFYWNIYWSIIITNFTAKDYKPGFCFLFQSKKRSSGSIYLKHQPCKKPRRFIGYVQKRLEKSFYKAGGWLCKALHLQMLSLFYLHGGHNIQKGKKKWLIVT